MNAHKILTIATVFSFLLLSCGKDDIESVPSPKPDPDPEPNVEKVYLSISPILQSMQSRAIVDAFEAGNQLGVYVADNKNVAFTYDGATWKAEKDVEVTETVDVYAYYPYAKNVQEYNRVEVDISSQNDFLYGKGKVSLQSPNASLTMNHALSLVKIMVKKNDYLGAGLVNSVIFNGVHATAVMDASTGEVTPKGAPGSYKAGGNYTLNDNDPIVVDAILLPVTTAQGISVSINIDGKEFTYAMPQQHAWKSGMEYTYTLNMRSGYNCEVDLDDVPIDIEYWSTFGKTDQLVIRDCGDDLFTVRPNYTKFGYDCYQNEGKVFGAFYSSYCDYEFEGKLRFVFLQGDQIVEKFQPIDINIPSGQWDGKHIQCYVTSAPGTYQVVPLFQKKGENTWFRAFDYEQGSTDAEWMYEVKAETTLPALRMINLENQTNTNFLAYRAPDDKPFNLVYTISNKNKQPLKGTVKAVWERQFKLKSNSYRPSSKRKGAVNDNEWFDELGTVDIDIASGIRFWKGIMECQFPVKRLNPQHNGVGYATPVVHLYWKAEGTDVWILLRQDADYLFNRDYTGDDIWDETTNFLYLLPESWS